jgi:sialic acid synthase SpsE/mannose-6-phosphate isomerase-like protein (cupin superfamily)
MKIKIVLDLANNGLGSLEKGLDIIRSHHEVIRNYTDVFDFVFKFQYRQLDSFIHSDYKDSDEHKYVKRFRETEMSMDNYIVMKKDIEDLGYLTACTPFDNASVDIIKEQNFDIIKIASCSINDWELLQDIAKLDKPIIISTAGASLDTIEKVVSFFKNRDKDITLMHCVAQYPTPDENLELNQIDFLKKHFPDIPVGFSTHEYPYNYESGQLAIAKGVTILERHIDTDCSTRNLYSSTPNHIYNWLGGSWLGGDLKNALNKCGITDNKRYTSSEEEIGSLTGLRRGMWVNKDIELGQILTKEDVYFAIPLLDDQYSANDFSKYIKFTSKNPILANKPVLKNDIIEENLREEVLDIVKNTKDLILKSGIYLPSSCEMSISHQYGIDKFYQYGAILLDIINREYAKKIIISFPGQVHPFHHHDKKCETFFVLYGSLNLECRDMWGEGLECRTINAGDSFTVEKGIVHQFSSIEGCVFEEISTTAYTDDSFYEDSQVGKNKNRKTKLTFYSRWLKEDLK